MCRIICFFLAVAAVLGSFVGCTFFDPPYAFSNPKDPLIRWVAAENAGTAYMSDRVGMSLIEDFAVTPDGRYAAAVTGGKSGLLKIDLSTGSAVLITGTNVYGSNGVCIDRNGRYAYAVGGQSLYRTDLQANTAAAIYTLSGNMYFQPAIAVDENGTVYTMVYNNTTSSYTVNRYSSSGSFSGSYVYPLSRGQWAVHFAVSSQYLFAADRDSQTILILERSTGQTVRQIYWDGGTSQYKTRNLNGSAPVSYDSGFYPIDIAFGAPGENYDPAGAKVSILAGSAPIIRVFDTADTASPFVEGLGTRYDLSDPGSDHIAVDGNGVLYVQDRHLGFIAEAQSGDVLYASPPRRAGEFSWVSDICAGASGTIFIADQDLWQLTSYTPSTGEFKLFGTAGYGSGSLYYPTSIAAKGDELYCARTDPWRLMRYGSDGNLLEEITPNTSGGWDPREMLFLADGRLLTWGGNGFHVYDAGFTDSAGPLVPEPVFGPDGADGVALHQAADGRILCAVWKRSSFASFGTLSSDIGSYAEIWNSASDPVFSQYAGTTNGEIYRIHGIAQDAQGRIWVTFDILGAAVCFTEQGIPFGSLCICTANRGTEQWKAGTIFPFSNLKDGWNWPFVHGPVTEADGDLYFVDSGWHILVRFEVR